MIIRHYRTLREASALRDHSNSTLRFNRTRHEAGMHGPLDDDEQSAWTILAIFGWGLVGAGMLGMFLLLVLGWTA